MALDVIAARYDGRLVGLRVERVRSMMPVLDRKGAVTVGNLFKQVPHMSGVVRTQGHEVVCHLNDVKVTGVEISKIIYVDHGWSF